jgi:hypothetical protein
MPSGITIKFVKIQYFKLEDKKKFIALFIFNEMKHVMKSWS